MAFRHEKKHDKCLRNWIVETQDEIPQKSLKLVSFLTID